MPQIKKKWTNVGELRHIKNMFHAVKYICLVMLLSSCAGYKVRHRNNPFLEQGITSIAIPVFVNRTSLNKLTSVATKEAIRTFSSFYGLKVNAGDLTNEDAVVIGVIKPSSTANNEIKYTNSVLMNADQQKAIGNRNAFYVPSTAAFSTTVQLVILKRPTREEIKFFTTYFKLSKEAFPRTVFHKEFKLSATYSIENEVGDVDSAAPVRGMKNLGNLRKAIETAALSFGQELREVMANAF